MTPENPYANKHVDRWGRHIMITISLVVVVIVALMWLNESLFSEQRVTWEDYLSYYDQPTAEAVGDDNTDTGTSLKRAESVKTAKPNRQKPSKPTQAAAVAATQAEPAVAKPAFNGFTITGVSATVNLQHTAQAQQQVIAAWTRFSQNEALHEAVSWVSDSNPVYAYYYDISPDFSQANVLVGYAMSKRIDGTVQQQIRTGNTQRFELDANGVAPQKAWEAVYPNGVLLEQYDLDMQGKTSNGFALVIK